MCNILFLRLTAFRKMYGLVKTLVIKLGFESFVNSEESKTFLFPDAFLYRLRALLIQKRVKLKIPFTLSLYV